MKGYTLIELLVVLSLIAILLCFAIPSMQHLFLENKANTQINQLVRLLNYSRNLAVIEGKSVMVCPLAEHNELCGKNWQKGINIYLQISATKRILIKFFANFIEANLNWNRQSNKIIFAENGLLSSQNGSFIYQLKSQLSYTKRIIISSTGRIRIESIPNPA